MFSTRLRSYAVHEMLTKTTVCVFLFFLACTVRGKYSLFYTIRCLSKFFGTTVAGMKALTLCCA